MMDEYGSTKIILHQQLISLRRVTLFAVTLATTATFVCMFSIPLFYNYLQHVHSNMQNNVDFCKQRSRNIWKEVSKTQVCILHLHIKYLFFFNKKKSERNINFE